MNLSLTKKLRRPLALTGAGLALAFCTPALAQLTKAESRMAATVDAEYERSVALLEKLVNQNSGSMNFDGVRKVGDMMRGELEPLGFRVEWLDMAKAGRAGHLVATKAGRKGSKRLLLIAHLDTVFEPDSPFQKFMRKGERAEGPGAGDDKGGLTVIVRVCVAAGSTPLVAVMSIWCRGISYACIPSGSSSELTTNNFGPCKSGSSYIIDKAPVGGIRVGDSASSITRSAS